ncbi:phosphotransferase family protein [Nocardia crassostreae]|uniref:phosphotransferase family protein n=1 Tax=Nocardia crassostreae TaxID=53428 RepID=UPI001470B8EF|nr:phosphotransferase [Nocardia crassostreae]
MTAHSELAGDWAEKVGGMLAGSVRPELARGTVRVLGEGMESVAVLVTSEEGEFVVRMPKGVDGAEGIAQEARLLPELGERVSVVIPRFAFLAANPIGPGECCVYPAVPGDSVGEDVWRARGLLERGETARVIAGFIGEVQGFPVERARELGVLERDMRAEYGEDLERIRAEVIPLLPRAEGRELLARWEGYLGEDENFAYAPTLIHADISLDHVLLSGDRISGVIDFGDAQIGDPDYDLCYLWPEAGAEFVRRVRECRGLELDARLAAKLDFWASSDSAIDVLHAIDHAMPEFRDVSVRRVCEALARFGGQGARGSL